MTVQGRPVKYGWVADLPDYRDYLYATRFMPDLGLPETVDLRSTCPPVVDQGHLGSCTANALAGAFGFLEIKDGKVFKPVSRLFVYYNERVIEGTVPHDYGARIRDGVKSMVSTGVCIEDYWPYEIQRFSMRPPARCFDNAGHHKVTRYFRLETIDDMRQCLANGFPFVFGFTVYSGFESEEVSTTGVVPMPEHGESMLGGHAVLAVGYDHAAERFIVRNSWGAHWGQAGYFTMPYAYLDPASRLASDLWTLRAETR